MDLRCAKILPSTSLAQNQNRVAGLSETHDPVPDLLHRRGLPKQDIHFTHDGPFPVVTVLLGQS